MKPYRDDENRFFKNHISLEIPPLRPFKIFFFQEYFVFHFLRHKTLLFLMTTPAIHTTKNPKDV